MRKGGWRWLAIARCPIEGPVGRAGQEIAESLGGPGENYHLGRYLEARTCLDRIYQVIAAAKKSKGKEATDG
jgi:hypothetical protein